MFKVLVSDPISDQGIRLLHEAEDVEVIKKTGLDEDGLPELISDIDALLVRSQTKVTARIIGGSQKTESRWQSRCRC